MAGVSNYAPRSPSNYSFIDATAMVSLKNHQEFLGRYSPIEVIPLLKRMHGGISCSPKTVAGTATVLGPRFSGARKIGAQPEMRWSFTSLATGTAAGTFYLPHDIGYQGPRSRLGSEGLATILSHSISDLELEDALKPVDADQLLLIIDACNSGQALKAEEERRGPMNTKGLAQLAYEKGMYVLTASQSDEVAFASAGLQHSYLAYAWLKIGINPAPLT